MSAPTLGARYLAACAGLGVRGLRERMSVHADAELVPDLFDPATMGGVLGVYDDVRARSAPDPVYLAATVYGLTAPETQLALVEALERLAAERVAAAGGAP
jgi:hypothetical protein